MPESVNLIGICIGILCIIFPVLAFFGFFENRKTDKYNFRYFRFILMVASLVCLDLAGSYKTNGGAAKLVFKGTDAALKAVLIERTNIEYTMQNLIVMFPTVLNDNNMSCFRSAFSNYVDDQWSKAVREESCETPWHGCADDEVNYYNVFLNSHYRNIYSSFAAMNLALGSIWVTASNMYKLTRSIQQTPDSQGHIPAPSDSKTLEDYNRYIDSCAKIRSKSWAVHGANVLTDRPKLYGWGAYD